MSEKPEKKYCMEYPESEKPAPSGDSYEALKNQKRIGRAKGRGAETDEDQFSAEELINRDKSKLEMSATVHCADHLEAREDGSLGVQELIDKDKSEGRQSCIEAVEEPGNPSTYADHTEQNTKLSAQADVKKLQDKLNSLWLKEYQPQYDRLPDKIKKRCSWEKIKERLLADNAKLLIRAKAMQGGGELFGVDSQGKALFRDRFGIPVLYGLTKKNELRQVYNANQKEIAKLDRWASYDQTRERVLNDGYELFKGRRRFGFVILGEEMEQYEDNTNTFFLRSGYVTWIESDNGLWHAQFNPDSSETEFVSHFDDGIYCGAIRLLRV